MNKEILSRIMNKTVVNEILPTKLSLYEAKERMIEKIESSIKIVSTKTLEVIGGTDMGFKEDLARERKLELETQNRYEYYEGIIKQIPYFKDLLIHEGTIPDYERVYKESLLPTLQPECQKVIDDSISFWEKWKSLPALAEKKNVFWSMPTGAAYMTNTPTGSLTCRSIEVKAELAKRKTFLGTGTVHMGYGGKWAHPVKWLAKYKWPDGSIHCNFCVADISGGVDIYSEFAFLNMFRALREEKLFLQKVQQKLDIYNNNMREGSQEYVQLCYYERPWGDYSIDYYYLYIFKDGTVYYDIPDYSCSKETYPLENSVKLYDFLLKKMKHGPKKYMSYQQK